MKVKINQTCIGSPDGIQVNEYKKGEAVELPDSLAEVFISQGWASRAVPFFPDDKRSRCRSGKQNREIET